MDNASRTLVTVGIVSLYLALEGVDGSGKSTLAAALKHRLESDGLKAIVVREPGGTPAGEVIRSLLLDSDSLGVWTEAFLFAAQRSELAAQVIEPALASGTWVISDRSYYSSLAYQGHARGLGVDAVRQVNLLGLAGVVPDLVFVIDTDPEQGLARQHRADRIGSEGVEFQQEVRRAFLDLAAAEPDRVVVLDGSMSVEELVEVVIGVVG